MSNGETFFAGSTQLQLSSTAPTSTLPLQASCHAEPKATMREAYVRKRITFCVSLGNSEERGVEEHDDGANDEVIFEFIRIAANYYYLSKHSQLKRHKLDLPKTSAQFIIDCDFDCTAETVA